MSNNPQDNKTFETKVANLIAATRQLDVPQILLLRRMTLADPASRRWSNERQLQVVFSVILAKAFERTGLDRLREARDKNFAPLLPPAGEAERAQDIQALNEVAVKMLGHPQAPMAEHEAALEKLLSMAPKAAPAIRTQRQIAAGKEPPPLFAAQLGPETERQVLTAGMRGEAETQLGEEKPFTDFPTLFDDTLCAFSQKILDLFLVRETERSERMPFMLAPTFGVCYQDVLRRMVLPAMRSSRHIQNLATAYNWQEVGGARLIDIIQSGEVNNPILHNWDNRWNDFRSIKGKKQKPEDNPWQLFRADATNSNYAPPSEEHVPIMQDMIRYELDAFSKAWKEISQLYAQEYAPSGRQDQAREGALRDGLLKWATKLPDHVGEFFIIKSYFVFPRLDHTLMRKLVASFGRTETERKRHAPFLYEFVFSLGN